jgi:type IX secretion system substrate protein
MIKHILLAIVLFIPISFFAQDYNFNSYHHSNKVSNGCGVEFIIVGNSGLPDSNKPATLDMICTLWYAHNTNYMNIDTLGMNQTINDIAFSETMPYFFDILDYLFIYVTTDSFVYIYYFNFNDYFYCDDFTFSQPYPFYLPDVKQIEPVEGKDSMYVLMNYPGYVGPNFQIRDKFNFLKGSQLKLNFAPLKIKLAYQTTYVLGVDTNNSTHLAMIDYDYSNNKLILKYDIILDSLLSNPIDISAEHSPNGIYIYSAPGDTIAVLSRINVSQKDTFVESSVIYNQSPCKTYAFQYDKFYFQPKKDTSTNNYDKQIISIDYQSLQLDTIINLNKDVFAMGMPDIYCGFAHYFVVSVLDSSSSSTLYLYNKGFSWKIDSFQAGYNANRFFYTYVYYTGINEQDVNLNDVNISPNPAKDMVTFEFSEKLMSKKCLFEVHDILGNAYFSENTMVEQLKTFDMSAFPAGLYIFTFKIDDLLVNQKVIKL